MFGIVLEIIAKSIQQGKKKRRVVRSGIERMNPKDSCQLFYLCLRDQTLVITWRVTVTHCCVWQMVPRWAPTNGSGVGVLSWRGTWPLPHSNHSHLIVTCLYVIYWLKSYSVFLKILDTSEEDLWKIILALSCAVMCGARSCRVCLRSAGRSDAGWAPAEWQMAGVQCWARNGKTRNW